VRLLGGPGDPGGEPDRRAGRQPLSLHGFADRAQLVGVDRALERARGWRPVRSMRIEPCSWSLPRFSPSAHPRVDSRHRRLPVDSNGTVSKMPSPPGTENPVPSRRESTANLTTDDVTGPHSSVSTAGCTAVSFSNIYGHCSVPRSERACFVKMSSATHAGDAVVGDSLYNLVNLSSPVRFHALVRGSLI
jgi:hypothetical protein